MKHRMLMVLLLCLSAGAMAQNEEQMQRMMEHARQAQMCMEKIDRGALQIMAKKAQQIESEIKRLCAAGQRDEAQRQGMKYGMEMAQSPLAGEMRKCSEMMAGAMTGFTSAPMGHSGLPSIEEMQNQHICDVY